MLEYMGAGDSDVHYALARIIPEVVESVTVGAWSSGE